MSVDPVRVLLVHNRYRTSAPSGEDQAVANERRMLEAHGVESIDLRSLATTISMSRPGGKGGAGRQHHLVAAVPTGAAGAPAQCSAGHRSRAQYLRDDISEHLWRV